jgi:hypothetical protein
MVDPERTGGALQAARTQDRKESLQIVPVLHRRKLALQVLAIPLRLRAH